MNSVYTDVQAERERAHRKHVNDPTGSAEHRDWNDLEWLAILGEEFGEVCKAMCERDTPEHLREELIQVAAMACAWSDAVARHLNA